MASLEELQKRLLSLENERAAVLETSTASLRMHEDTIAELHREHKELRAALKTVSKQNAANKEKRPCTAQDTASRHRRQLDQLKSAFHHKKKQLRTMQDKLKDMDIDYKGVTMKEESPQVKQVRALEDKLDKTMIKYNEAHSIRKTYQQIVKQLKEEKDACEHQLLAIERSLKGKEHDFGELRLLSHDAKHAEGTSKGAVRRLESQVDSERRARRLSVDVKKKGIATKAQRARSIELQQPHCKDLEDSTCKVPAEVAAEQCEAAKQCDYEAAFRRLRAATGVSDPNDIIQKFNTQSEIAGTLRTLRETQQTRLAELSSLQDSMKQQIESLKYAHNEEPEQNKELQDLTDSLAAASAEYSKCEEKYKVLSAVLRRTEAGIMQIKSLTQLSPHGDFTAPLQSIYWRLTAIPSFSLIQSAGNTIGKASDIAPRTASILNALTRLMPSPSALRPPSSSKSEVSPTLPPVERRVRRLSSFKQNYTIHSGVVNR